MAGRPDAPSGGGHYLEGLVQGARRQVRAEWFGSPPHLMLLKGGAKPEGFVCAPRDFRPARPKAGKAILEGTFPLAGRRLAMGRGGDPWDRASPDRRFAEELHAFEWLRDLIPHQGGSREGLRLTAAWSVVFGNWNAFSWSGEVIERRVFNLACAGPAMAESAIAEETQALAASLAAQALHLLLERQPAHRKLRRWATVGVAGAALGGKAGEELMKKALRPLGPALSVAVLPDGGFVSRSPEEGMELLLDLLSLDDALAQRGGAAPDELPRAIDRLTAGLRFFTLADGKLACFQGGETSTAARVTAARAHDEAGGKVSAQALHSGYQRLSGKTLQVIADAGPPAANDWSETACAQPLAIEVLAGRERLITNAGWSPRAEARQALRLTGAGSTAVLGANSAGHPLSGTRATWLGPRLVDGAAKVTALRRESGAGQLLEMSHDGWVKAHGLIHHRRLYLDGATDELRGEDRFEPAPGHIPENRLAAYAIHFHLYPGVSAVVARDNRSVLISGGSEAGWWLRNDAQEVRIEPSVHMLAGAPRKAVQIILTGHLRADKGGKVRWKLTAAER